MITFGFRWACLLVLMGGSLCALSPRIMDNAADARRDADRRRRQQENVKREENQRRIRQEEEKRQEQRLHPDRQLGLKS